MDIASLLAKMIRDGVFALTANDPRIQFGTPRRQYLGATLLPERQTENAFTDSEIRYRSLLANAGSRYSPVQRKNNGQLVGQFQVTLGNQDIGSEFAGPVFDALILLLGRTGAAPSIQAEAEIIRFTDLTIVRPLVELTELTRWQALIDGQVEIYGDNGFHDVVTYPNTTGQRVNTVADWTDPDANIWDDILERHQFLVDQGYQVNRIITSRRVVGFISKNKGVATRTGRLIIIGGASETLTGSVALADINQALSNDGLPPIETYDLRYQTTSSGGRFMADDVMIFVCDTGRDETIDLGPDAGQRFITGTLGYMAIGRAAGQTTKGRIVHVNPFLTTKPPRLEAEGWQTSMPVLQDPQAFDVLKGIGRHF